MVPVQQTNYGFMRGMYTRREECNADGRPSLVLDVPPPAGTWEDDANVEIAPRIGQPALPVPRGVDSCGSYRNRQGG